MSSKLPLFVFGGADAPDAALLDGHCPQCKTQLVWTRKNFHMGVKAIFDICPTCLPENVKASSSPQEAVLQIESLEKDLQAIANMNVSCTTRDIERVQTELQYMIQDMKESGSTNKLDTDVYEFLVKRLARSLENNVDALVESSAPLQQPPTLRTDLVKLLSMYEYGGCNSESACPYALVDVLRQLEEVRKTADLEPFDKQSLKKFQNQVVNLQVNLQQVQHIVAGMPMMTNISGDVSMLSERYGSLNNEKSRFAVCEMGGIDTILIAMQRFPDTSVVQDKACSTIAFLAKSAEPRAKLRRKRAASAVRKAATVLGSKSSSVTNALNGLEKEGTGGEFQV